MDKSHSIIWNFPYSGNLGTLWAFSLHLAQCSYSSSTWPYSQQFQLWVMHFASGNMFLLFFFFLRCATLKGPDPSSSFFMLWSQLCLLTGSATLSWCVMTYIQGLLWGYSLPSSFAENGFGFLFLQIILHGLKEEKKQEKSKKKLPLY